MSNIAIGKVIEVSNTTISVVIHKDIETPYMILSGKTIRIGGVGSFVKIENDVFEIVNEKISLEHTGKEDAVIASDKVVFCRTIGFFIGDEYKQGSSGVTPNIFDNVYTVSSEELTKIYSGTTVSKSLIIGKYLYEQDLEFCIDINKYFASHTLIVGNTGSGKSNTLNTLYTELFENINTRGSYFLIVDTNGEYAKAFTNNKEIKYLDTHDSTKNTLHLPINLLQTEDWKLLLEATEKTQYPIIKTAWNRITRNVFNSSSDVSIGGFITEELKKAIIGILNSNTNASNKYGAINNIREDISYMNEEFYKKMDEIFVVFDYVTVNSSRLVNSSVNVFEDITSKLIDNVNFYKNDIEKEVFTINDFGLILNMIHLYRTYRYNNNENNTSPLIARFNSNKREFGDIFLPYKKGDSADVVETLFGGKYILVCDVSKAKKDIRRIIVTFLCSKLYGYFCNLKRKNTSLHLIVDEAHNYLSSQNIDKEDAIAKTCIETFEGIIKEGRKFSVFLTMATQRPSDITPTLLSQSHNYIIHKLVNPRDIDIIKNTVPFIDDMSMKMLSILAPGQAIFSGTAFNRPNIVQLKYDESITRVESDTIKLMDTWIRKKNFDKGTLSKLRAEADYYIERSIFGEAEAITLYDVSCWNCKERYICNNEEYAPVGFCLNCGHFTIRLFILRLNRNVNVI